MALHQHKRRAPETPVIPDRLYFKIGDVARICGVETYVLRFWETQFPPLKPNKSGTGQRLYRRGDVELALKIKQLVHGEGYTIAGARAALGQPAGPRTVPRNRPEARPGVMEAPAPEPDKAPENVASTLAAIRTELQALAAMLADPQTPALELVPEAAPTPDQNPVLAPAPRRRARVTQMPSLTGSLFPMD